MGCGGTLKPNIVEIARTKTVDALSLVRADHDILDRSTALDDENSIGITAFGLALTGSTAAVVPHVSTTIKDR